MSPPRPERGRYTDERGVSGILGYVLTFAVVLTAVTLILSNGLGALDAVRTTSKVDSAAKGMDITRQNVQELSQSGAPVRTTELQLNGGTLAVRGTTALAVTVRNPNTGATTTASRESAWVVHEVDDRTVGLDAGARFRSSPGGTTFQEPPPFVLSDRRTALTLLTQRGNVSLTSESRVELTAERSGRTLLAHESVSPTATPLEVEIRVDTSPSRARAWKGYFERAGLLPVDANPADGTIAYEQATERVIVRSVVVDFTAR